MKNLKPFSIFIILLLAACSNNKQSANDLVTVDVTTSYPYKELILQDFMDVEYIPLETNDEFLCQGNIWAVGDHIIVASNFNLSGDIFIFDRSGKALKKINHKGQSGEEYSLFTYIVLDENNRELFVNDQYAKKILVYDLEGNFKRKLSIKGDLLPYEMYSFDGDNLICRDDFHNNVGNTFMLISKQDGTVTREIQIPFKEKKDLVVWSQDKTMTYFPQVSHPIKSFLNDFVLSEYSSDTLYKYSTGHLIKPFIVRTPTIHSMSPEVFLLPSLFTERYYFMVAIEKTIDFSITDILYDKQENTLFRYIVYNDDYTHKEEAFLKSRPLNGEIPSCQYLESWKLVKAYQGGRLKGQLKEVASKLNEEDNPVIMLIKQKQ